MTRRAESDARELSDPAGDAAGQKLREAFAEAQKAIVLKMKKQFGTEFIHEFASKMRHEVEQLPLNVSAKVEAMIAEKLDRTINTALDNNIRQFWGDFIQKEIRKAIHDPGTIIELAKQIKGLI